VGYINFAIFTLVGRITDVSFPHAKLPREIYASGLSGHYAVAAAPERPLPPPPLSHMFPSREKLSRREIYGLREQPPPPVSHTIPAA